MRSTSASERTVALPVEELRARFPALRRAGDRLIFADNAAGAQVPDEVVEAVRGHLVGRNVQRGGRYAASIAVDHVIHETRAALAEFVNAASPDEIVFGLNATSLIRAVAEAMRPGLRPGDEVVVSLLDHEANIGPWIRLERDGVAPRFWGVRGPDARLDLEELRGLLRGGRVRVVALPLASNACGRIVDVAAASALAREAGTLTFVDAVHFGPHGPIDARALGVDFLAFSGYKIFGPHMGFLWGRADALRALSPAREFFIPAEPPYAFEAGTQTFEGIAGIGGAMAYLRSLDPAGSLPGAMARVRAHERGLSAALLRGLAELEGVSVLGDADPARAGERVPTVSFRMEGADPSRIVERLAEEGIQARDGHMYAPRLLEAAGIDTGSGVVRLSLCHYNTTGEIDRVLAALRRAR
jgi:cysteine desulfurase family protein (TIGR01976 family)